MINYTTGDLLQSGAQALVNTVNCVGVMGKGIALHFKQAFPHNFAVYADACRRGEVQPGRMLVVDDRSEEFGNHLIVNFPTKQHWRNPSQYEWVEAGLRDLVRVIREQHISSIAIPPLGCGNGGLDWSRVKPMIEQALSTLDDVAVTVYEPSAAAAATLAGREQQSDARLTPARAMLLYAMFCYEAHDERCSLFVANKLSYFYQMLGEESFARIPFVAHYYGPYSVSVGHMLSAVNGKYLHGLEEMDRKPFEALMLDYGRKAEVGEYVHTRLSEAQRDHIRSLLRLIDGYESAYALEVLASVAYVRTQHPGIGLPECISEVQGWSQRKRNLFQPEHIEAAYRHLDAWMR
ncbi:MAG: macro domain-containing protein [Prevotella sp.]|nr:macro domain-containing protein [Prevotella sp.]